MCIICTLVSLQFRLCGLFPCCKVPDISRVLVLVYFFETEQLLMNFGSVLGAIDNEVLGYRCRVRFKLNF